MKRAAMAATIRTASATPTPIPAAAPDESSLEVFLFPTDPTLDCAVAEVDEDVVEAEPVAKADIEAGDIDDVGVYHMLADRPGETMTTSYICNGSGKCSIVDIRF
jgi:hypothetical protein